MPALLIKIISFVVAAVTVAVMALKLNSLPALSWWIVFAPAIVLVLPWVLLFAFLYIHEGGD